MSQPSSGVSVVLVHGAWADGSSWNSVIKPLQARGIRVIAAPIPLTSLKADVQALERVLERTAGPVVLGAHAYAGAVISASTNDRVRGLVFIAAFGLDEGEVIGKLGANYPPTPASAHLIVDAQGMARVPQDDFITKFAADVDPVQAKVMYAVQQSVSVSAFGDAMGIPAWKSLPSWYLVATNDQAIAPDEERFFAKRMGATTVEVVSGHVAMVSHPDEVANLIVMAAEAVPAVA